MIPRWIQAGGRRPARYADLHLINKARACGKTCARPALISQRLYVRQSVRGALAIEPPDEYQAFVGGMLVGSAPTMRRAQACAIAEAKKKARRVPGQCACVGVSFDY